MTDVTSLRERVKKLESERREVLEQRGIADGKLTPALIAHWRERSIEDFESYLAIAPRVIPQPLREPTPRGASAHSGSDAQRYMSMTPTERAALKRENPDEFAALRAAAVQEGLIQ